jgi:hypothetical protein
MLNDPDSELAGSMEYYIPPEGNEPHAEAASADEIRVLEIKTPYWIQINDCSLRGVA